MAGEKRIENYLGKCVKRAGGLYYKWVSPSNSGVPDRIVLINRRVAFIELKDEGEKPRPLQKYVLGKLSAHGYYTAVVDSREAADLLIADLLREGGEDDKDSISST